MNYNKLNHVYVSSVYLRSSFTSVASRSWRSNGTRMPTRPIFSRRPMWSNWSLKKWTRCYDARIYSCSVSIAKCAPSDILLWHLLWDLQVQDYQLHPGDRQHPGKQGKIKSSEDLPRLREGTVKDQSRMQWSWWTKLLPFTSFFFHAKPLFSISSWVCISSLVVYKFRGGKCSRLSVSHQSCSEGVLVKADALTGEPGGPGLPGNPRCPLMPLEPRSPVSPLSPRGPWGPYRNIFQIRVISTQTYWE